MPRTRGPYPPEFRQPIIESVRALADAASQERIERIRHRSRVPTATRGCMRSCARKASSWAEAHRPTDGASRAGGCQPP